MQINSISTPSFKGVWKSKPVTEHYVGFNITSYTGPAYIKENTYHPFKDEDISNLKLKNSGADSHVYDYDCDQYSNQEYKINLQKLGDRLDITEAEYKEVSKKLPADALAKLIGSPEPDEQKLPIYDERSQAGTSTVYSTSRSLSDKEINGILTGINYKA